MFNFSSWEGSTWCQIPHERHPFEPHVYLDGITVVLKEINTVSISLSGSEQPGAAQVSIDNALVSEGSDWYIFTFSGTYIVPFPRLHPQCGFLITWDWLGWNCEEIMSNGSLRGCGNLRWPPIGPSMKTFFTSHSTPFLHLVCWRQIIWPPRPSTEASSIVTSARNAWPTHLYAICLFISTRCGTSLTVLGLFRQFSR